jgi:hypothetical protein
MKTENRINQIKTCPACGGKNLKTETNYRGEAAKWCLDCNFDIDIEYLKTVDAMGKPRAVRVMKLDTLLGSADGPEEWKEARKAFNAEKNKIAARKEALLKELETMQAMERKVRRIGSTWENQLRGE